MVANLYATTLVVLPWLTFHWIWLIIWFTFFVLVPIGLIFLRSYWYWADVGYWGFLSWAVLTGTLGVKTGAFASAAGFVALPFMSYAAWHWERKPSLSIGEGERRERREGLAEVLLLFGGIILIAPTILTGVAAFRYLSGGYVNLGLAGSLAAPFFIIGVALVASSILLRRKSVLRK